MTTQTQNRNHSLDASRVEAIRSANDALRTRAEGGRIGLTPRVAALPKDDLARVCRAVNQYHHFSPDSDPYGIHDFGSVLIDGRFIIAWTIDAYDLSLTKRLPDAANPAVTSRMLTIMLADEY